MALFMRDSVIEREGRVWFGKIGKGLGIKMITLLNSQIMESVATYIYLATRVAEGYKLTRGSIERVQSRAPRVRKAIPEYYRLLPKGEV